MPVRTEYAEGTPSWVDLSTSDPAAAKDFYAGLFGWTYRDDPTDQEGGVYTTASLDGRPVAGLSQMPAMQADQGMPPSWNTYVTVDDVDGATKRAEAAGAQVFMAPMDVMDVGRMAVLADPTGAAFCLWQARSHIGSELVNEPGTVCWNELVTPDVDKAKAFYGTLFGWTAETADYGGTQYTMFNVGGNPAAGALKSPMEDVPPHWAVYFAVADTDATIEKAKAAGATVHTGPMDTPAGRMAGLTDPQGASLWVIKMADMSG